jgi:ribosome-associated toxin RatA of RatAB toxin-antitoxin module
MDSVRMSTVVYADPEEVFEFLMDFEGYKQYSGYVNRIHVDGDGGVGTEYGIEFSWWKLSYLARSRVVGIDRPRRIEWEIIKDVDADGQWIVDPVDDGDATRVTIDVNFDPDSVGKDTVSLPFFVDVSWLVDKAVPLIVRQARNVLRGVVADLEGEPRDPELKVHETPSSVNVDEDDLDVTGDGAS